MQKVFLERFDRSSQRGDLILKGFHLVGDALITISSYVLVPVGQINLGILLSYGWGLFCDELTMRPG